MRAQNTATNPATNTWHKRETAGILADGLLRRDGNLGDPGLFATFLLHGRAYFWHLLEDLGWSPWGLTSFADSVTPAKLGCGQTVEGGR